MGVQSYQANWIGLSQAYIDFIKDRLSKLEYTKLYNKCNRLFKRNELSTMLGNEAPIVQRALYLSNQGDQS